MTNALDRLKEEIHNSLSEAYSDAHMHCEEEYCDAYFSNPKLEADTLQAALAYAEELARDGLPEESERWRYTGAPYGNMQARLSIVGQINQDKQTIGGGDGKLDS